LRFKRAFEDDAEVISSATMADITFLLIILFMVGSVLNVEKGIEMNLPQSTVQQDISEENVIISIDSSEKLYLDGEPVELAALGQGVLEKVTASPDSFVLVKSDKGVKYSIVIDVLDELLQVGITNIALPTEEENP
jgi:biopolymer transport protein ExbD